MLKYKRNRRENQLSCLLSLYKDLARVQVSEIRVKFSNSFKFIAQIFFFLDLNFFSIDSTELHYWVVE